MKYIIIVLTLLCLGSVYAAPLSESSISVTLQTDGSSNANAPSYPSYSGGGGSGGGISKTPSIAFVNYVNETNETIPEPTPGTVLNPQTAQRLIIMKNDTEPTPEPEVVKEPKESLIDKLWKEENRGWLYGLLLGLVIIGFMIYSHFKNNKEPTKEIKKEKPTEKKDYTEEEMIGIEDGTKKMS